MKFKIKYVDEIPDGFIGMNWWAWKENIKTPYPYSKNTIIILKGMSDDMNETTITHEKVEAELMRLRKYKYHTAHIISNSLEEV